MHFNRCDFGINEMKNILRVLIGVAFLIQSISIFAEPVSVKFDLDEFGNQIMDKLVNSEYCSIFSDYYIPANYTDQEIENDRKAIIGGLKEILENQLGQISAYSKIDKIPEDIFVFYIASGTRQTAKTSRSMELSYKTTFLRYGAGYVTIGICKEFNKSKINYISFGLPKSNAQSKVIIENVYRYFKKMVGDNQKISGNSI